MTRPQLDDTEKLLVELAALKREIDAAERALEEKLQLRERFAGGRALFAATLGVSTTDLRHGT